jgi:hypothetical protein
MYNILIDSGILTQFLRLLNICLNDTCSRDRVGKKLSEMCPIKKGFDTSSCLNAILFQLCFRLRHE